MQRDAFAPRGSIGYDGAAVGKDEKSKEAKDSEEEPETSGEVKDAGDSEPESDEAPDAGDSEPESDEAPDAGDSEPESDEAPAAGDSASEAAEEPEVSPWQEKMDLAQKHWEAGNNAELQKVVAELEKAPASEKSALELAADFKQRLRPDPIAIGLWLLTLGVFCLLTYLFVLR